jgi:hypothetical protein
MERYCEMSSEFTADWRIGVTAGTCSRNRFHQQDHVVLSAARALRDCGKQPHSNDI